MIRETFIPRPDWPQQMEAAGFNFHSIDGIYWDERAAWRFTAAEIDVLEAATTELHERCVDAAAHVIKTGDYHSFAIPEAFIPLIEQSWNDDDWSLFGRFDLAWTGEGAPKLLEYNADTPTSLIEASVAQWHWLEAVKPNADQFNSIHEHLIAQFEAIAADLERPIIYFTGAAESEEDMGNLDYLRDVATQAGVDARWVAIDQIGWNGVDFLDHIDQPISALFKLYPWEWLVRESFGEHLLQRSCLLLEPPWKMLLSNKAILPILWDLFPHHPNLLAASFAPGRVGQEFVKKPLLSREGANVTIVTRKGEFSAPGDYGEEGFIYQAYAPMAAVGDNHAVIGSWVVGGSACGIGIREDDTPITKNTSRFVPHYF